MNWHILPVFNITADIVYSLYAEHILLRFYIPDFII